jgi:hypothetical protein
VDSRLRFENRLLLGGNEVIRFSMNPLRERAHPLYLRAESGYNQ